MKTKYIILLFTALFLGFATFSCAQGGDHSGGHEGIQNIDHRIRAAHEKIDGGIQSGSLTREEAHRLKGELNAVRDDEVRMRADGRLNRHERDRLERELDRLERHIANLKQNDNTRGNDRNLRPSCHENCDREYYCERRCSGMGKHKHKNCVHECEKDKQQCKDKCERGGHRR